MSQRKGLHSILEIPVFYRLVQWLFYQKKAYDVWYGMVGNFKDKVVLDIGCGPGTETKYFKGSKKYIGVDISSIYIDEAKKNYPNAGDFYCCSIEKIAELPIDNIDIITIKGVFHHLSSDIIQDFLKKIHHKINPEGRIITLDCAFEKNKLLSNFVVGLDRGMHVRSIPDYKSLLTDGYTLDNESKVFQILPPYLRYYMQIKKV